MNESFAKLSFLPFIRCSGEGRAARFINHGSSHELFFRKTWAKLLLCRINATCEDWDQVWIASSKHERGGVVGAAMSASPSEDNMSEIMTLVLDFLVSGG